MKRKIFALCTALMMMVTLSMTFTSCEKDDVNPYHVKNGIYKPVKITEQEFYLGEKIDEYVIDHTNDYYDEVKTSEIEFSNDLVRIYCKRLLNNGVSQISIIDENIIHYEVDNNKDKNLTSLTYKEIIHEFDGQIINYRTYTFEF